MTEPLAYQLRPKKIEDIIGQQHLVGEHKVLYNMVKNKKIFSCILYGKPGIGKTSIASAIAEELGIKTRFLNAVINNKKDFDLVLEEAKVYGGILLIMDEIHRLNKDKQDLLLPHMESGLIQLIGLTTSNPYHKINPAIRSRCQIYELKELSKEELKQGLRKAIDSKVLDGIKVDDDAVDAIIQLSSGDLRNAYNTLEVAYYASDNHHITLETITSLGGKPILFMDKDEDGHYDVLSAFQKSIRGSDVHAALHYLARLIEVGDLDSIYRRMAVIAYEDIGLANPMMGPKVDAAIHISEMLGLPEARIPLSTVVIELALSPKTNSSEAAIDLALNDIRMGTTGNVPNHIKTHSRDYKYPHNYKNGYVKQQYLPDNIKNRVYYIPKETSKYEKTLKELYDHINKLKSQD